MRFYVDKTKITYFFNSAKILMPPYGRPHSLAIRFFLIFAKNIEASMKKSVIAIAAAALLWACAAEEHPTLTLVVGTYTGTGSTGLYSLSFDTATGQAALLDSCRTDNPSYLTFSADGRTVYAVSELDDGDGAAAAFAFDPRSGAFTPMGRQATHGKAPCYIATDGHTVVTANYFGGSVSVFPLDGDGSLQPLAALFNGSTGGPDAERQETPHVHCAVYSPDGKHLYASDFSADRILCFDVQDGAITPTLTDDGEQLTAAVEPDYGPRHIVFDPSGAHAYIIGELSGKVTLFDIAGDGTLTARQVIDGDPFGGRGSADIHISPDGRWLYTSNRLKGDGIAIFSVDESDGTLTEAGYCPTGPHPRNFNITPDGCWLLCACRDSDEIEVYSRDPESGALHDTGSRIRLKRPVCIQFAPQAR